MTGDQNDMTARLRAMLPTGWFADDTPILNGLLAGLANAWAWIYALLTYVQQQTRIATAGGGWLDLIARDFGGASWAREVGEGDAQFRARIQANLQRLRGTRAALIANLTALTGRAPEVFEPANATDTGGLNTTELGWNAIGGWGNLQLPYQCFVRAYRPTGGGIANVGGWGTTDVTFALGGWNTGAIEWGDADLEIGTVSDTQILAAVADSMPTAAIAWTALSN
jgi:hypothetical protein